MNAAKRLLERLKADYPRLPLCIQADNLYETHPIMELCARNGFYYMLTHKGSRQKNLHESYQLFCESELADKMCRVGKEKGSAAYVNHVEKTVDRESISNIFEYRYETESENGRKETNKISVDNRY